MLFHPILPVRVNDKLMFPLCQKCAKQEQDTPWFERQNLCPRSDEDRTMTGTWCINELQRAVKSRYRIIKIHEV